MSLSRTRFPAHRRCPPRPGLAALAAPAFAADYVQSAGSSLTFTGKYQGEAFNGRFPGFGTTFAFDPANLAAANWT